jgi:hypothetical protein
VKEVMKSNLVLLLAKSVATQPVLAFEEHHAEKNALLVRFVHVSSLTSLKTS